MGQAQVQPEVIVKVIIEVGFEVRVGFEDEIGVQLLESAWVGCPQKYKLILYSTKVVVAVGQY